MNLLTTSLWFLSSPAVLTAGSSLLHSLRKVTRTMHEAADHFSVVWFAPEIRIKSQC